MSHNLTLTTRGVKIPLYQTPTSVTDRAREDSYAWAKEVYFRWLDEWAICVSSIRGAKAIGFEAELTNHKRIVEEALSAGACWGST